MNRKGKLVKWAAKPPLMPVLLILGHKRSGGGLVSSPLNAVLEGRVVEARFAPHLKEILDALGLPIESKHQSYLNQSYWFQLAGGTHLRITERGTDKTYSLPKGAGLFMDPSKLTPYNRAALSKLVLTPAQRDYLGLTQGVLPVFPPKMRAMDATQYTLPYAS